MATQAPRLVDASGVRMARPQKVARDIVIIDGISRSGKSLVCPLLGTLERGELWLTDHLFEYLCAMDHLKRIRPDAAEMLARLYADFDLYNLQIGRYTNLRPTDITGAAENLLAKRYQDRLLEKDGDRIIEKIRKERPFLFLMTHYVFDTSRVLFDSFGSDLKMYLLTTRHPIWLVESWHEGQWDRRMGADPREFQLVCRAHGKIVPWFAAKWAKRYLSLNSLEKSIEIVAYFSRAFDRRYRTMDAVQRKKVFILPYEDFSTDPDRYLGVLCDKLGTRRTKLTSSMLKRMGFPRSFSWAELERKKELMEHQMQRCGVRAATRNMFRALCSDYEKKHDLQGLKDMRA